MSEQTTLSQEVVAQEVPSKGISRRGFVALTAAACGAATMMLNGSPAHAVGYSDGRLMRYLEEIERLQLEFFTRAALSGTADGLQERETFALNGIAKQDNEHAYWFKIARQRFGLSAFDKPLEPNQPQSRPSTIFRFSAEIFTSRAALYSTAISLKETSVGAYHGAVVRLGDPELIQAVAALAGVEGRHLAMLRELSGQSPFVAYEPALSVAQVTEKFSRYGFSQEVF